MSTIIISSDDKEVGMAHKVKSPKNQPQFPGQQWGSIGWVKLRPT